MSSGPERFGAKEVVMLFWDGSGVLFWEVALGMIAFSGALIWAVYAIYEASPASARANRGDDACRTLDRRLATGEIHIDELPSRARSSERDPQGADLVRVDSMSAVGVEHGVPVRRLPATCDPRGARNVHHEFGAIYDAYAAGIQRL